MDNKMFLTVLLGMFFVIFISNIFAEQYGVTMKAGTSNLQENAEYISVDKNRALNEFGIKQRVQHKSYSSTDQDESRYNIDIENWVEPKEPERDISQKNDNLMFGRGAGVDMDTVREIDATGRGAIDAREARYIREDSNL